MQYIMYSSEETRKMEAPPNPDLLANLDKLTQDMKKSGALVTTGGLSGQGTRLKLTGGKFSGTGGPLGGARELMGGFVVINVKSLDEAIEWAKRFRTIVGDGESEIV